MQNDPSAQPVAAQSVPSLATGPRTEAGKAASSQNARKHDLCSKTLRLSAEEWAEYNGMRARYARDLLPADDVEETLVDEICFNYWRLQQARDSEFTAILQHPSELPLISLYIRYRTGYERAFYKALDQIQKCRRDRRKPASSPTAVPLAAVPLAAVRSAETQTDTAAVRSEESSPVETGDLMEQFDRHITENRVRSAESLSPLPFPKKLADGLDQFVSRNPGLLPPQLLDLLKKVA
jgi:hypothetical protein